MNHLKPLIPKDLKKLSEQWKIIGKVPINYYSLGVTSKYIEIIPKIVQSLTNGNYKAVVFGDTLKIYWLNTYNEYSEAFVTRGVGDMLVFYADTTFDYTKGEPPFSLELEWEQEYIKEHFYYF